MYSLHATQKLLDRAQTRVAPPVLQPTTALGNWYGTVLFWRPQAVLLVNEATLFPVLLPLAPAATLIARIPDAVGKSFSASQVAAEFIDFEVDAMAEGRWAKTANRSVLGSMNGFRQMGDQIHKELGVTDLVALALRLAEVPCGPLHQRQVSPDRELDAHVSAWLSARGGSGR